MSNLVPNQILSGCSDYALALDLVIQAAYKSLCIFDQDLSEGAYTSAARAEMLGNFLANQGQLTLILHEPTFLLTRCPRLISLMQTYQHAMQVCVTADHVKHIKEVFIVADETSYVKRFHIDQARFKYSLDDLEAVSALKRRFDELQLSVARNVSISILGL